MKVEVGFITSWRKAIFFSAVLSIIVFGLVLTLVGAYVPEGLPTKIISLVMILGIIVFMLLVVSDKLDRFRGVGTAMIENGRFVYNDKKHHYDFALSDMSRVDIEKIALGNNGSGKALAYQITFRVGKKKYAIESERAYGCEYEEVDLYRLYLYMQENMKNA